MFQNFNALKKKGKKGNENQKLTKGKSRGTTKGKTKGNLTEDRRPARRIPTDRFLQIAFACFLLAFAMVSVGIVRRQRQHAPVRFPAHASSPADPLGSDSIAIPLADALPAQRRLYAYSVIPGGVESAQELMAAARHDSVVAAHYADFKIDTARVITLDRDRAAYVSYRLGSKVFWTNRKVELHRGESLLTDGTHEARARCGNRISDLPQTPVAPAQQPSLEALELFPPTGPLFASNLPIVGSLVPPSAFSLPALAETHPQRAFVPFFPFAPGPGSSSRTVASLLSSGNGTSGSGSSDSGSSDSPTGSGFGGTGSPGTPVPPGRGSPSGPGSPTGLGGAPITASEPGTLLMLGIGLCGLGFTRKLGRRPFQEVLLVTAAMNTVGSLNLRVGSESALAELKNEGSFVRGLF